jgi:gentisate 1,2-dioxygenase
MHVGDLIATPNWTWHDHGHEGTEPVVWMDGLDTPFTNFFGATFREDHPEEKQPLTRQAGAAAAFYGTNMLPVDFTRGTNTPLLLWPYARSREALHHLAKNAAPHAAHGYRLKYADPSSGGHLFPTMAVFLQWLPKQYSGAAWRGTDGTVFNVVEGHARVEVGKESYHVGPHDVFVVPPWERCRFHAEGDCVLFSYSDRAAQEALGFWREEVIA